MVLAAHLIFRSAGALRLLRGAREHRIRAQVSWWLQYYPPLIWLPLLVAVFARPLQIPIDPGVQLVAVAVVAAAFGAAAMWSLGRGYGIDLDIFVGAPLVTGGVYRIVRHPMYLGIVLDHLGAGVALGSGFPSFRTPPFGSWPKTAC